MSILEATKLMCAGMNQNRVLNLFPPHLYTVKEVLEIYSREEIPYLTDKYHENDKDYEYIKNPENDDIINNNI
jgi:hypothetical protein